MIFIYFNYFGRSFRAGGLNGGLIIWNIFCYIYFGDNLVITGRAGRIWASRGGYWLSIGFSLKVLFVRTNGLFVPQFYPKQILTEATEPIVPVLVNGTFRSFMVFDATTGAG